MAREHKKQNKNVAPALPASRRVLQKQWKAWLLSAGHTTDRVLNKIKKEPS